MAVLPKIVYNFNENNATTIRDYSENGNDGTGANVTIAASTRVGNDVVFNGVQDIITISDDTVLNNAVDCAIHLAINISASAGTLKILNKASQIDLEYNYTTNILTFTLDVDSGAATVSTAALSVGTFYDFDFIYESNVLTLYQDNVSVDTDATKTGDIDSSASIMTIGPLSGDSGDGANFLLNEFKVYDEGLTSDIRTALIAEQNGILSNDRQNDIFNVGDVIYSSLTTTPVYAVVSWVGLGADYRFLPLTVGILNGMVFKRGAHLWDVTRQWGLKIDDAPQVTFYDLQTKSSEIFAASKKTISITGEGIVKGSTTKTANYTVLSSDQRIYVDSSAGAFTITLEASPTTDRELEIIDSVGSCNANTVTVNANGNNIIGSTTYSINTSYEALKLIFNGSNWNLN